jgi:hypothetical protein
MNRSQTAILVALALAVVVALSAVVRAEPPPPAAEPAAAPVDPVARCKEARHLMAVHASTIDDLQERGRYLLTLPDCAQATAADVAALPIVDAAPVGPRPPYERGFTFELAVGPTYANAFGTTELVPGSALNIGVGKFLSNDIAVSLRLSGALLIGSGGAAYFGTLGPNAQLYVTPSAFVGAGAGFGFLAACASDCAFATTTIGFNARAGYAFARSETSSANLAVEVTTVTQGLATVSLLLGFQSF